MAFCDILSTDVKITFCQIPRAVLGIDIIAWWVFEGSKIDGRLLFCITLAWYSVGVMRSRRPTESAGARGNEEPKQEVAANATELDETGNSKTAV